MLLGEFFHWFFPYYSWRKIRTFPKTSSGKKVDEWVQIRKIVKVCLKCSNCSTEKKISLKKPLWVYSSFEKNFFSCLEGNFSIYLKGPMSLFPNWIKYGYEWCFAQFCLGGVIKNRPKDVCPFKRLGLSILKKKYQFRNIELEQRRKKIPSQLSIFHEKSSKKISVQTRHTFFPENTFTKKVSKKPRCVIWEAAKFWLRISFFWKCWKMLSTKGCMFRWSWKGTFVDGKWRWENLQ